MPALSAPRGLASALLIAALGAAPTSARASRDTVCTRGIGGVLGVVPSGRSWEFVGRGAVAFTGSPVFNQTCSFIKGNAPFVYLAVDIEPWAHHIYFNGTYRPVWALGMIGYGFGGDVVRGGVHATVGPGIVGGGMRLELLMREAKDGTRAGLETRANVLAGQVPDFQFSIMMTLTADTLKKKEE